MPIIKPGQPQPPSAWKIIMLYGDFGAYKSSMALTAKNALLIDFGQGSHRVHDKDKYARLVIEHGWPEVESLAQNGDFEEYDTIIIDEIKAAIDRFLIQAVMEETPGLRDVNGGLTQNGYGVMFNRFMEEFLAYVKNKNIIVIAHGDHDGDEVKRAVPLVSGKTGQFFGGLCDQLGYVHKIEDKVVVDFSNSSRWISKDRAGIGRLEVPHYSDPKWPDFLQREVLDKLGWGAAPRVNGNTVAPKAQEEPKIDPKKESEWFNEVQADLNAAANAEQINALMEKIKNGLKFSKSINVLVKTAVKDRAASLGLEFNKAKKAYQSTKEPVVAEEKLFGE